MIVIADSGSTKTDWAILEGNTVTYKKTEGIQPRLMSIEQIAKIISPVVPDSKQKQISSVYFFGTGCGHKSSRIKIRTAIETLVPESHINIKTDLEGAAIGMYGNNTGIIGILGTGCNCGFWNGSGILSKPLSCGYLLGDEGSGYYIGKLLIESYIKNNMPPDIAQKFQLWTQATPSEIVEKLYQQENPSRFMAQHAKFASDQLTNDFIQSLLTENFNLFFRDYITKIKDYNTLHIKLIGSIAVAFEKQLKNSAWNFGCSVSATANNIIEKLAEHYKREETLC